MELHKRQKLYFNFPFDFWLQLQCYWCRHFAFNTRLWQTHGQIQTLYDHNGYVWAKWHKGFQVWINGNSLWKAMQYLLYHIKSITISPSILLTKYTPTMIVKITVYIMGSNSPPILSFMCVGILWWIYSIICFNPPHHDRPKSSDISVHCD